MIIPDLVLRNEKMWVEFDWLIPYVCFDIFFGRRPDFADADGREYCIHIGYVPDGPTQFLFDRMYDEDTVCEDGLTADEIKTLKIYTAGLARAAKDAKILSGSNYRPEVQ